jgi:hypothetical protein
MYAARPVALRPRAPAVYRRRLEFLHFGSNGTVYGAKLWSACSSLPLFHQPACWRANCPKGWAAGQFDVEAALRRHWRGKLAATASNCPTTRGWNSRKRTRGKEFPQASLREGKRQRAARTPKLRSAGNDGAASGCRAEGPLPLFAAHREERTPGVLRPKCGLRMTGAWVRSKRKSSRRKCRNSMRLRFSAGDPSPKWNNPPGNSKVGRT